MRWSGTRRSGGGIECELKGIRWGWEGEDQKKVQKHGLEGATNYETYEE